MTAARHREQLLLGLPSSGKTTFVAAFWHVIQAKEIETVLELAALEGDRAQLNRISEQWANGERLDRTTLTAENFFAMRLVDRAGGEPVTLVLPDMSGESFAAHWRDRQWPTDYGERVSRCAGAMLVIHPEQVRDPMRIDHADPLAEELGAEAEAAAPADETVPWSPDIAATQAQLVELLQLHREHAQTSQLRVAVVISAWDLIASTCARGDDWCRARLPLLHQFLDSNPEDFEKRYFGVSAQGGDLTRDRTRLQALHAPSHRIQVIGAGEPTHDLTSIVHWSMG